MTTALLLVDLQRDFLAAAGLRPRAAEIVERAAALLNGCRRAGVPVVHIQTTVHRDREAGRMAHWRRAERWMCEDGTPGHRPPDALAPREGEAVFHKAVFSPFVAQELAAYLRASAAERVVVAGVHLHACVRATALDAYQRGFEVWLAGDAVGSDDPVHADETRRYLVERGVWFAPVEHVLARLRPARDAAPPHQTLCAAVIDDAAVDGATLEAEPHACPRQSRDVLWSVPASRAEVIERALVSGRRAAQRWSTAAVEARAEILSRVADAIAADAQALARQLAIDVGKPIVDGAAEIELGVAAVRAAVAEASARSRDRSGSGWRAEHVPHGVVAAITPFNNPLAVPLIKLAPALLYGNAVVWKPAPAGSSSALSLVERLVRAGVPPGVVNVVLGDHRTAQLLVAHGGVDAVTLTGSSAAGTTVHAICARRRVPLQAELGGNNATVVWSDADIEAAAAEVAAAAFGSAGQRCTATRRAVVEAAALGPFVDALERAAASIPWGDPLEAKTRVGPLISARAQRRVAGAVDRARAAGHAVRAPQGIEPRADALAAQGWYYPPTIVRCDDARDDIVQDETFGPVLVVTSAADFDEAIRRVNGVDQGLAAALFSTSRDRRARFAREVQAGVVKLGTATSGVAADAPFGGWRASGIGPPERGDGDRAFYRRTRVIYGERGDD